MYYAKKQELGQHVMCYQFFDILKAHFFVWICFWLEHDLQKLDIFCGIKGF